MESVIFVPSTRGGVLTRKLREREDELARLTGFSIKFQEARGTQMLRMFSINLGGGLHCGRKPCPPCDSSEESNRGNCRARNLVYKSSCSTHPAGRKMIGLEGKASTLAKLADPSTKGPKNTRRMP